MKKIFWIFLLLYGGHAAAQVQRDSVRVYYKTGKSELISDFRDNGIALDRFVGRLRSVLSDARYRRFHFRVGDKHGGDRENHRRHLGRRLHQAV